MYRLPYFKEESHAAVLQLLEDYPFALLTGSDEQGRQVATQVPLLHEERDGVLYLQGHIMRHTDHHRAFVQKPDILAVFTGPDAYVSASWYTNPQIGSTWNYMSVHVTGRMRFLDDKGLVELMKKFTLRFEQGNTSSPTFFDNLPKEFLDKMLPGIASFEIRAEKTENVFKLSQNRDEASYRNIITQLRLAGGRSQLIAEEMEKRFNALFPPGVAWDSSKFLS